jgi:hypothetical protein
MHPVLPFSMLNIYVAGLRLYFLRHVAAHPMAVEVQADDAVLGRSAQPARELPQLIRRQLPEAGLKAFALQCPVGPAVGISPQVQLRRCALQSRASRRETSTLPSSLLPLLGVG